MKPSTTRMERVIAIMGSIFVFVSFLASIILDGDQNSILELIPLRIWGHPFTSFLLPIAHGFTCLMGITCIIKPGPRRLIYVMLFESIVTILTAYEQLGIFLFYAAMIIMLLHNEFTKRSFIKVGLWLVVHFISITLSYTHGWPKTFIAYFTSAFYASFFLAVYTFLRSEFCIIPANVQSSDINKLGRGSKLSLSNYKLSERQINMVYDLIFENLSYKELSDKYFISISTVKKDFAEIFKVFQVENVNELKILLLQFQISK